jgi:hypothetical protein
MKLYTNLFKKYVQMWRHITSKAKGKCKQGEGSSSFS